MEKITAWLASLLTSLTSPWSKMSKRPFLIFLQVILLSLVLILIVYQLRTEVEISPCSAQGFPGRCYHVDQDICEVVWTKSETTCNAQIRQLSLPPGRLVGPIMAKCQLAKLDSAFANSRKSNTDCDAMKKELEEWKSRNPNFR